MSASNDQPQKRQMTFTKPNIREVSIGNYSPFDDLLSIASDVFDSIGSPTSDDRIFVDLFPHGTIQYHFSNLIVARYLSIHTGRKLVGLTTSAPLFIRTVWNSDEVMRIARAFGVNEVIKLDRDDPGVGELSPDLRNSLMSGPSDFAENVELSEYGKRYYGFEDRLRRRYLSSTLSHSDIKREWLKEEYFSLRAINASLKKLNFQKGDYFICGHVEYDPYKTTALHCIQAGGHVIYNWALQPFTLKKLSTEEDLLCQSVSQVRDVFDEVYAKLGNDETAFQSLASLYLASLRRVRPTLIGDRSSRSNSSDLPDDPQNVLIMAQAMSDGVHCYGPMLYRDFSDWIQKSISVLTDNHRRVYLRNHPMQDSYDQGDFIGELAQLHSGDPRFSYSDGTDALDISGVSLAVTTQGTPGIELPLDGIRTVNVGRSRYSGFGLVDEPQSQQDYEALLLGDHALSEAEARDRYQRAALFGYLELFCFRGTSRLLPFGLKGKVSEFVLHLRSILSMEAIFSDPLFAQVGRLVSNGDNISLNTEGLNMFARDVYRPIVNVTPQEEPADWWKSVDDSVQSGGKSRSMTVADIRAALSSARSIKNDKEYATAVFQAFFSDPPPDDWMLGAYKCLGRPWGRGRLIRHAFNAWKARSNSELSWSEFRKIQPANA